MKTKFTKQQLENWERYEDIRLEGRFNMFDPNARMLTGLSREEYTFVMNNFTELRDAATKRKPAKST